MKNKKLLASAIAAAAAFAFTSIPATSFAADAADQVNCFGVNGCKGQGSCKSSVNACKGQNNCKSQGFMQMSAADCTAKGGTTTEPVAAVPAPAAAALAPAAAPAMAPAVGAPATTK